MKLLQYRFGNSFINVPLLGMVVTMSEITGSSFAEKDNSGTMYMASTCIYVHFQP
jgi:hypothetical protein